MFYFPVVLQFVVLVFFCLLSSFLSSFVFSLFPRYETQCRGRSRADREWRVVRNCPLLPADRHNQTFLNRRIERSISTSAASLSPATAVQFRVRCHTAGGWSPFSKPSDFGYTSRSDWWGKAVHPRVPRKLEELLIAEGSKKNGVYNILNMMKRNLDKVELQKKAMSVLSGHVTLSTVPSFTIPMPKGGGGNGNSGSSTTCSSSMYTLQRAKMTSKGVRPDHAKLHADSLIQSDAIEIVCSSMKLHRHSSPIQEAGLRLLGWWVMQNGDNVRRRIVQAGGLECAERNQTTMTGATSALWCVELLRSKLDDIGAALLVQTAYRRLKARRELERRREALKKEDKEEEEEPEV